MTRVICSSCGKPAELKEMGTCPSCSQYLCRDCERHFDGYCQHCLNAENDMTIL